jgi:biotin carboxyl carrier protein
MKRFRIKFEGKVYDVEVEEVKEELSRQTIRHTQVTPIQSSPIPAATAPPRTEGGIHAPIAGKVLQIKKKEGDSVDMGEIVFVMESMKMEVYVRSRQRGTIRKIHAILDSVVEANTLLAEVA